MKLSEKIVALRKKQGMSQEMLAEKLGVSRQAVSRWELDSALPDASNLLQLSRLFGVSADYLLNDDWETAVPHPVEQETKSMTKERIRRIVGLCAAAAGVLGHFAVYILSRMVEVMVPVITYDNGERWYTWRSDITGRSYRYFVQEYNLELLVLLFWILVVGGLAAAFLKTEKVKRWIGKKR